MARVKFSDAVQFILDSVKARRGEQVLTEEQAKVIFGGDKAVAIADLPPLELIQYALCEAYAHLEEYEASAGKQNNRPKKRR